MGRASFGTEVTEVVDTDAGEHGELLTIRCADGVEFDLLVTTSAPPGGDNHTQSETIVRKKRAEHAEA